MMKLGRALVLALAAQCVALAPAWAQKVTIASEGARPPFNQLDEKGELAGFEIDLARELCARAALDCAFVQQEWDQLLPALELRQADAVISTLEPNEDRRARVLFGEPYLRMPSAFLAARKRQIRASSPGDLAGRAIGVEQGSPHQAWLEEIYGESRIRPYASLEEAILDLAEGRIDLVLGPKDALASFMKNRREAQCCKLLADAPRDPAYFGEGFAMAFGKEAGDLRARFDAALKAALADGAYERIRAKYFDWPVY